MSTQIRGNKQIKNITIENDQIVNGTVELNKLKEGAELFKRDGSVPATNNLNLDGHQLKNIGTPVDGSDAVRKVDLDELAARVGGTLINRELVSGVKDGVNVEFTLANEPTLATEQIFLNGLLLNAGANADYSIQGNVITFTVAPQATDAILANYIVEGIQLNVDVQATLAAFNGRLTTAESELFDAEQAIVELGNDADILAGRVTNAETDISTLEVRATNIENNVDAVEADIATEETRAMAAESALAGRATASENEIVSLKSRMTTAEGDIVSLEAADSAMDSRVGTLEDGLQAETTARINAVNSLNTRVVALENDDTAVDGRLDVLESDVAALESDLAAEAATRLANDNTLQSNINAEIANRTAAVSAVQSNLNTEIADRFAADVAEESARIAADAVIETNLENEILRAGSAEQALGLRLDEIEAVSLPDLFGRMDVVESNTDQNTIDIGVEMNRAMAAESALSGRIDALEVDPVSQAYVDQKISELVNSAPAVLDTLKELSDALGGDENFATTISAQIGVVDDRVDTVVADLGQEALDRIADVDAEETRAMAAESVLSGRIDSLEADPVTKTYVDGEISSVVTTLQGSIDGVQLEFDGRVGDLEVWRTTQVSPELVSLDSRLDALETETGTTFPQVYATITYVDGEVAGEESRAMAAESALDARVDALEADPVTKTYVDGEISDEVTARIAADDALDARVDALESAPPPVTALSYLSDVTVASPSNGQVLQYNGTEWVNGPAPSTFSGSYNDLSNKPDLSVYALDTDVAAIDTRVDALEDNAFVTREVPAGLVDGSNAVFTLANTPVAGSEQVFLNGMLQESGAGNDYTISGDTITFASAPLSGWKVHVSYATGSYMVAPAGAGASGSSTTEAQWSSNEQVWPFEKGSNGETIYFKEVDLGAVSANSTKSVAHNISGFQLTWLFRLEGRRLDSENGSVTTCPWPWSGGATTSMYLTANDVVCVNAIANNVSVKVKIFYAKSSI